VSAHGEPVPPARTVYTHGLRVYWEDTDAGGVVFYANYLKFFERARTEWLRLRGPSQELLRREQGLMFVVAETTVRYLAPARLDDWIEVTVQLVSTGRVSMEIDQQALRRDGPAATPTVLAAGRIRIGCVDALELRPQRIPSSLLASLTAA
jgi:acyl-CoA thioester hydrolase